MSLYVSNCPAMTLEELARERRYDLALVSVGYEERARAIATNLQAPALGIGLTFADRKYDAYPENVTAVRSRGYELWEPDSDAAVMVEQLAAQFERAAGLREIAEDQPLRVAVDISSMTRVRIAAIIQAAYELPDEQPAIVDLLYAPAEYAESSPPPPSWVHARAVSDHFAGWDPDAEKPLLAVVGLGYEPNAAEGVVDYLTPDESFMFVPDGRDPRYRRDVESVNREVLAKAEKTMDYSIEDPYRLALTLERLVLSRIEECRLLLVPLGPKIFTAACLVTAQRLHPLVSVWRFSAGSSEKGKRAKAAGWICGMRLSTRPEASPGFSAINDTLTLRA
jgi:hypothetical protein